MSLVRWPGRRRQQWESKRWHCGWRMSLSTNWLCISGEGFPRATKSMLAQWYRWTMLCCRRSLPASRRAVSTGWIAARIGSVLCMSIPQAAVSRNWRLCLTRGVRRCLCLGSRLLHFEWCRMAWRSSFRAAPLYLRALWRLRMRC